MVSYATDAVTLSIDRHAAISIENVRTSEDPTGLFTFTLGHCFGSL